MRRQYPGPSKLRRVRVVLAKFLVGCACQTNEHALVLGLGLWRRVQPLADGIAGQARRPGNLPDGLALAKSASAEPCQSGVVSENGI